MFDLYVRTFDATWHVLCGIRACSLKQELHHEHPVEHLRIDGERLWQSLMDLGQIGATPKAASAASP